MDLTESPEHRAYREKVRSWFDNNKPGQLETFEERRVWHRKLYDAGAAMKQFAYDVQHQDWSKASVVDRAGRRGHRTDSV